MKEQYATWYENFIETTHGLEENEIFSAYCAMLSSHQNTFSLNHKVMEKTIESGWVETIEAGLLHVDNVMRNPRKTIENVEEVVPIALSRKITSDSIKHLAQHTDLIQSIDPKTGKITPSKILNVHKEESLMTYENKFVNTLIDRLYIFVNRRYDKLKAVTRDEEAYSMEYTSSVELEQGQKLKMTLHLETVDSLEKAGVSGVTLWERVEKLKAVIESYKASSFCQQMGQAYIRPPVMRTNAIMKNVDLKACLTLWQFIEGYDKVGYEITVSDTAQQVPEAYIQNFYALTALNYLLFQTFTSQSDIEPEALKTKKGRAISPKIVRRFEKETPDAYHVSVGVAVTTAEGEGSGEGTFEPDREPDYGPIFAEIDAVIQTEREFLVAEQLREAEEKRIAAEKERKRQEEEARRLAEEQRLREEQEAAQQRERERQEAQRLAEEKAAQEKQRQEELAKEEAARLERERLEQEKLARLSEEERLQREQKERERLAREERDRIRSEKLKAMRTEVETWSFQEIYRNYTKNPIYVLRRTIRHELSLLRGDGKVLWEGDTKEPILAEKIAKDSQIRQAELRRAQQQEEINQLHAKYSPTFLQKRRQNRAFRKKKKHQVYRRPAVPPVVRTPEEEKQIRIQMKQLYRTYHVSVWEKCRRRVKALVKKVRQR